MSPSWWLIYAAEEEPRDSFERLEMINFLDLNGNATFKSLNDISV